MADNPYKSPAHVFDEPNRQPVEKIESRSRLTLVRCIIAGACFIANGVIWFFLVMLVQHVPEEAFLILFVFGTLGAATGLMGIGMLFRRQGISMAGLLLSGISIATILLRAAINRL